MSVFLLRPKVSGFMKTAARYKHGPNHWSVIRKKETPKDKALEHFDDFYKTVYGKAWPGIRTALLKPHGKYMAVVNNFSDTERIMNDLEMTGAINVRTLYEVQAQQIAENKEPLENDQSSDKIYKMEQQIENMQSDYKMEQQIENMQNDKKNIEVQSLYPSDYELTAGSAKDSNEMKINQTFKPAELTSMEESMADADLDLSRIIKPSIGMSSAALYEYIPATKLKGMEDWVLESDHYEYYKKGADFSVQVQKETVLNFPKNLQVYTYEQHNETRFRSPRNGTSGVKDYYLLDGGSILPVLALDLKPGDSLLDMCAAPGGKTLVALQTLMPGILVSNDVQKSRVIRINEVLSEYFSGTGLWDDRLFVTQTDARVINDKNMFNKILVDVPCTTDRHSLHDDENNIFSHTRIKERLKIPELQSDILTSALKLVRTGGTVVYSTCTLSPIQNDGVVQMALKKAWEETNSVMVVKDITEALEPLKCIYRFGNHGLRYGNIVLPTNGSNFGPTYFCKIVRTK